MAPVTRNSVGGGGYAVTKRSKRVNLKTVHKPSGNNKFKASRKFIRSSNVLSASRIITASPMILASVNSNSKFKKKAVDSPLIGIGSPNLNLKDDRTSTPTGKAKRLSDEIKELSPIAEACLLSKHNGSTSYGKDSPKTPVPVTNKLGNPLLSSTKLHKKLDNDRLTNAVRLYEGRLRVRIGQKESKMIQSQLLHKNAIFDTFLSPSNKDLQSNKRQGQRSIRQRTASAANSANVVCKLSRVKRI